MTLTIKEPSTQEEFEKYYRLRWEILRKPWKKPIGSEKDELEDSGIHGMILDNNQNCIAVCRLHKISDTDGQIRFMAVDNGNQKSGIGSLILSFIEQKAKENRLSSIVLHSRENAVQFYKKNGYEIIEKSYLMWDSIQHFLMKKTF